MIILQFTFKPSINSLISYILSCTIYHISEPYLATFWLSSISDKLPKFRSQALPISPIMSQVSDGGILLILCPWKIIKHFLSDSPVKIYHHHMMTDSTKHRGMKNHIFSDFYINFECILMFSFSCVISQLFQ